MTRSSRRNVLISLVALLPLLGAARAAQADGPKIGYVDLQRAINETEDGRREKARLKGIFDRKQKELDERSEALKAKIEDLNKKRTLLPEETRLKKEAELSEEMRQVQETYMRHQKDLAEQEQQATGKILERMQRIIGEIAVTEDFTLVLDRNQAGLIFAKPEFDLTNQLIRRYNSGAGAGPAPGASPTAEGGNKPKDGGNKKK